MRSVPSMQAPGALIADSCTVQSRPHSAAVHAARESIRTATLYRESRRYTQRFSVLSGAVTENARISNGGEVADRNVMEGGRTSARRIVGRRPECNGGRTNIYGDRRLFTGESRRYTQRFSVLSGAVTENARILNGGKEERTSDANIKSRGGKTTKVREYRAEFSVLAKRSRKTRAIGPDRWSLGGCSGWL